MLLSWHVDDQLDDGLNNLLIGVLNDATNMSRCLFDIVNLILPA